MRFAAAANTPDIEPLSPFEAHPLVRTHPDSGRRILHLGEQTEVEIVYWDNQATLHARSAFDNGERRVLKRISLSGSRPY